MGSGRNGTNERWSTRREGGGARGLIASDGLRILVGRRPEGGNRGDVQKDSSTAPMADGEFSPPVHLEPGFRGISVLQDPAQRARGFLVRLRPSGGPLPRNPRAAQVVACAFVEPRESTLHEALVTTNASTVR